jgi:hypothetical protein
MVESASPWHDGERRIRAGLGVAGRMEEIGTRVIRDALIAQHRAFYPMRPEMSGRLCAPAIPASCPRPIRTISPSRSPAILPILPMGGWRTGRGSDCSASICRTAAATA